jgi:hypothetical protein
VYRRSLFVLLSFFLLSNLLSGLGCTACDYPLSYLQFVHTCAVCGTIRYMKIVLETILIEIRTLSTYHFLLFTKLVSNGAKLIKTVPFHSTSYNRITRFAILDTLYVLYRSIANQSYSLRAEWYWMYSMQICLYNINRGCNITFLHVYKKKEILPKLAVSNFQ